MWCQGMYTDYILSTSTVHNPMPCFMPLLFATFPFTLPCLVLTPLIDFSISHLPVISSSCADNLFWPMPFPVISNYFPILDAQLVFSMFSQLSTKIFITFCIPLITLLFHWCLNLQPTPHSLVSPFDSKILSHNYSKLNLCDEFWL